MVTAPPAPASRLDPSDLLDDLRPDLKTASSLLLVQDLDGVCMDLVLDPLQRQLDGNYVQHVRMLDGRFSVLTNGEHEGQRGVNRLVERAVKGRNDPARDGLYLPGLAAGGVQLQNRFASVSTPGVQAAELAFLAALPQRMSEELRQWLPALLPQLDSHQLNQEIQRAVLDNPLSPTVNLNGLFSLTSAWEQPLRLAVSLQEGLLELMQRLLLESEQQGLTGSFFLHLAPNFLGANGQEQPVWASAEGIGTTDIQFMLRGAVKEAGLLVLINEHIARHHGQHPLGRDFSVRTAPHSHAELVALAEERIPPALMPRLVGIGDTITSRPGSTPGQWLRGGSDRGFLTLLQELGERFDRPNRVVLVDSSGGEVCRPSMRGGKLEGLTDADDPLRLDTLFPDGPKQYRAFVAALAASLTPTASPDQS